MVFGRSGVWRYPNNRYVRRNTLTTVPGGQVRSRDPSVQNLQELTQAIHVEWQRIPVFKIRRLIVTCSMGRGVSNADTRDID